MANSAVTLNELFRHTVAAHRDRPAVALGERTVLSYGELEARVLRLAGALRRASGGRAGERVVLVMANTVQYVELMFAIWLAGLCAVPVNAKLHPQELDFVLRDCGARVCVSHRELLEGLRPVAADIPGLALVDAESAQYEQMAAGEPLEVQAVGGDDLAWLFYTSGTTGRPKGVMLTHSNLVAMAMCFHADVAAVDHRDAIVHVAPLSHGSGLYAVPIWMKGGRQVVPPSGGFDAAELFDIAAKVERVNLFASPTIVRRMVRHAEEAGALAGHLNAVIVGGAPFYVEDVRAAVARLGPVIAQIYGQGETPMTITAQSAAEIEAAVLKGDEELLGSVGAPQSLVEVQIRDAQDRAVRAGELGEVVVRGATVMKGYWQNEAATQAALAGGWLHTGDLGYLTPRGFLVLKDRSKDLIISGGSNIYPREVEEVLLRHAGVAEAAVVGRPSVEWGEEVCAFIVPRSGATLAAEDLDRVCLEHIARFKRPKEYFFVDSLPKNNTGKVLKTALREMLLVKRGRQFGSYLGESSP